jgi:2-hydroxychromene-2-carboxylate isomerase
MGTTLDERSGVREGDVLAWYFDVVSPFSYLALPTVEALARRRPVLLRPIVSGVVLVHWGKLGPAEIEPKRLHTYRPRPAGRRRAESAGLTAG